MKHMAGAWHQAGQEMEKGRKIYLYIFLIFLKNDKTGCVGELAFVTIINN